MQSSCGMSVVCSIAQQLHARVALLLSSLALVAPGLKTLYPYL